MKIIISILVFQFSIQSILGCGCGGPINDLKVDIDSSDVIFIGEITEINSRHSFHLNNNTGFGLKYLNFNILRTNKGLNSGQLKISVFDFMSNSSCQGLINGKQVGDTILLFGAEFNNVMIGSYLCGRHPKISELTVDERIFVDTTIWTNPKNVFKENRKFLSKHFPSKNTFKEGEEISNRKLQSTILYCSLILNMLLGIFFVKRRTRDNKL